MGYRTYDYATSAISAGAGVTSVAAIAAVAMTAITLAFSVFLPARADSSHTSDHGARSNIAAQAADTPSSLAVVRERIEVVGMRSSEFAIAAGGEKAAQCARATC